VGIDRGRQPLRRQQTLEAVAALRLLPLQVLQAAVQLPAVLVGHAGHVHHAPDLAFAAVITAQQVQQFARVDRIGLGPLAAAIHLDGAGVYDDIDDPSTRQGAVQPKAITASPVAGADRGIGR
jgi:hypothetical protein